MSCVLNSEEDILPFLRTTFQDFSCSWLWEFLLNTDRGSDLVTLTAPVNVSRSWAFEVRNFRVSEQSQNQIPSLFSGFRATNVGIPSFYIDNVAVGVIVSDFTDDEGILCSKNMHQSVSRFAQHISKAKHLTVEMNHADNTVVVLSIICLSASMVRRSISKFHLDSFCAAVPRRNNEQFDYEALKNSLLWTSVSRDQRPCIVCGSSPSAWCGCAHPRFVPSHSLDFEKIAENSLTCLGFYTATNSLNYYFSGKRVRSFNSESCVQLEKFLSSSFANKLIQWGVKSRLQGAVTAPGACEISGKGRIEPLRAIQYMGNDTAQASDIPIPDGLSLRSTSSQGHNFADMGSNDVLGNNTLISFGLTNIDVNWDTLRDSDGIVPDLMSPTGNSDFLAASNPDTNFQTERSPVSESSALQFLTELGILDGQGIAPQPLVGKATCEDAYPNANPCHRPQNTPLAPYSVPEQRYRYTPTPADAKREARKQRNRESAARSNLKRKLRNEARKREQAAEQNVINDAEK